MPIFVAVCIGIALLVFFASRYFYKRRLQRLLVTYDAAKNDFLKELNVSKLNRENFEAILSSMVEAVIVINAKGTIEVASPNFYRMLELRSKQIQGKLYWEVISNQEISDSLKEALVQKRALNKEINIIGPPETFFSMQISPVIDQEGRLFSLIAVFHDITELKKLEKLRSEFVANVSHELKTPLTAIKGFVETLKESMTQDPQAAGRFLDIIDKQAQRLENLVNDLLILSSLESKEIKMNFNPEALIKIIQASLVLQKKNMEAKQQQMSLDIPADLPKVLVDRQRIEQVFLNVLDNAVKFTPEGGHIQIIARWQPPYVMVEVKDNGVGIAREHLSRIFERFYRVDRARAREAGGTGLGLAIVHQIVSSHQGRVEVESSPGLGSSFRIFLPYQI